jgi:hypothetical protein
MKNLILPMAGKSTRFNTDKPKWMLTHPFSGTYMALASITGINLSEFVKLYFVFLKAHQEKFNFESGFREQLSRMGILGKSELIFLEDETDSPAQTVYEAIKNKDIKGSIYIKDSDSYFQCAIGNKGNFVSFITLEKTNMVDAKSKSYIQMDKFGTINNIVEKRVISSSFSVGGYGFQSASEFVQTYLDIGSKSREIYISDIIFQMILSGKQFEGLEATDFEDWGTLESWNRYCKSFNTIFVDIDGTLVENSSILFEPYIGSGKPLEKNIEIINGRYTSNKSIIILTTSRPEYVRDQTILEMKQANVKYHYLIMGLPHSKRILINDFSTSNQYPTSIAINLPRNSSELNKYFEDLY